MTEDTDNKTASAEKLLRFLAPIRRWKSTWRKFSFVMLITFVVGYPVLLALNLIALSILGESGLFFSLPIGIVVISILPAIALSYSTHKSGQWRWKWRSISMWSLATPCMLCIFIGTGILGGKFYEGARLKDLRSTRYATLIERKIAESEAVNGQQSPVRLVQFRPAAIDRLHRIILIFKNSYEISQTSESKKWGTIDVWTGPNSGFLYPNAELRLIAATGSVLKSTNRVDQEYLMTMKLEFTPHDLDDYSVEFIGPPKGFAEYRIVIEAQGIE